jgi:hypothetical protein
MKLQGVVLPLNSTYVVWFIRFQIWSVLDCLYEQTHLLVGSRNVVNEDDPPFHLLVCKMPIILKVFKFVMEDMIFSKALLRFDYHT